MKSKLKDILYARIQRLQDQGHDIRICSGNDKLAFTNKDESKSFASGLSPQEAEIWLDGWKTATKENQANKPL